MCFHPDIVTKCQHLYSFHFQKAFKAFHNDEALWYKNTWHLKSIIVPYHTFKGNIQAQMCFYPDIGIIMVLASRASGCLFGHPNP